MKDKESIVSVLTVIVLIAIPVSFFAMFIFDGVTSGWFFFFIFVLFVLSFIGNSQNKRRHEEYSNKVIRETIFESTYEFNHPDGFSKVAINSQNKTIYMVKNNSDFINHDYTTRLNNFSDLIEVKVKKDAKTITSSSANLGGALVGGVFAGGLGAVVGSGVGGESLSKEEVNKLSLELVFNDIDNPTFEIDFYNKEGEIVADYKEKRQFEDLSKLLETWYRRFEVIIYQEKQLKSQQNHT